METDTQDKFIKNFMQQSNEPINYLTTLRGWITSWT